MDVQELIEGALNEYLVSTDEAIAMSDMSAREVAKIIDERRAAQQPTPKQYLDGIRTN